MGDLIYKALRDLLTERKMTVPELSRKTVRMGIAEVPQKSIEALLSEKRAGQVPKAHTIQAIAAALDVEPGHFYEWPIAEAQAARAKPRPLAEVAEEAARLRADKSQQPRKSDGDPPNSGQAA